MLPDAVSSFTSSEEELEDEDDDDESLLSMIDPDTGRPLDTETTDDESEDERLSDEEDFLDELLEEETGRDDGGVDSRGFDDDCLMTIGGSELEDGYSSCCDGIYSGSDEEEIS